MITELLTKILTEMPTICYRSIYGAYFIVGRFLFSNAHVFNDLESLDELSFNFKQTSFFRPVEQSVPDIAVAEIDGKTPYHLRNTFDDWPSDLSYYCFINPMINQGEAGWLTVLDGQPLNENQNPLIFSCQDNDMPIGLSGAPLMHAKRIVPEKGESYWQIIPVGVIYAKDSDQEHLYAVSLSAEMNQILTLLNNAGFDNRESILHNLDLDRPEPENTFQPALNAYELGHLSEEATFTPMSDQLTLLRRARLTETKLSILSDSYLLESKLTKLDALQINLENILKNYFDHYFSTGSCRVSELSDCTSEKFLRLDYDPGKHMTCIEDNIPKKDHKKSARFLAIKISNELSFITRETMIKACYLSALYLQTVLVCKKAPYEKENETSNQVKKSSRQQKIQQPSAKKSLEKIERDSKEVTEKIAAEIKRTKQDHFEVYMKPDGQIIGNYPGYTTYLQNPSLDTIKTLFTIDEAFLRCYETPSTITHPR